MREIRSLPIRLSGTGSSGPAAPLIDVLSKGKVILANELINRDGKRVGVFSFNRVWNRGEKSWSCYLV